MPTISPVARAVIGGNSEEAFRQPRATVTRSTGMALPKPEEASKDPQSSLAQPPKTGQSDTSEETESKAVTLSPQLTALAKKQQKLQQEVQALRDKESAFAAKEADFIPKTAMKAKAQSNALEAIKEAFGMTYDELTNLILQQQQGADPVQELKSEIQKLKDSQEQSVSKQYEATVAQYRKEIESLVARDDNFVTIREEKREDAVLQHILDTFEEDGAVLSVEEASKDIEDFLVEEAEKKLGLTKVKAKLAPPAATPDEKKLPPPKTGTRTLTQQVETAPTRTFGQFQHLSMKERIAQAIARAQK